MIPLANIFLSEPFQLLVLAIGLGLIVLGAITGKTPLSVVGLLLALMPVICWSLPPIIAGILMSIVGVVLMLLEVLKHGAFHGAALGVGALYLIVGIPCIIAGPAVQVPEISASTVLYMAVTALVVFTVAVIKLIVDTLRARPYSERMINPRGRTGTAVDDIEPGKVGYVKICGEYWRATSQETIKAGEEIIVIDVREDGLLIVKKKQT